jgi:chorismate dehydratase
MKDVMSDVSDQQLTIAAVRYLNARPLIYGLDQASDLRLIVDVPSKLIDSLRSGEADVALLPVIDYQKLEGLRIIPAGGIGSDGETLTVRIFSKRKISDITVLACDPDSHTSVALARVLLAERFGVTPEFVGLENKSADAQLLIGDKVVCQEHHGFDYQLDLGEAWKNLTGLPFVFAAWTARPNLDAPQLAHRLETAKRNGLAHVEQIIQMYALPSGWRADVARRYLTEHLKFDVNARELRAIEQFHGLCAKHNLLSQPVQPVRLF